MTSQTTTHRGPKHERGCPCVHCYGTQQYDIRSRCMGCTDKIPHGDVQLTAIGVMHHSCAYQLGWVARLAA